jgi:hypothetical protein
MTLNIPAARGVPGFETLGQRAPQWWDPSGGGGLAYDANLDSDGLPNDPRWNQATRHEWATGTTTEGIIRALYQNEPAPSGPAVFYLTFQVLQDPTANTGTDGIFLGLQGASGIPHVFELTAYSNFATGPQIPTPTLWKKIDASDHYDTDTWPTGLEPAWLNTARSWVTVHGSPPNQSYTWAINVRIPTITSGDITDAGMNLGSSPKIFVALIKDTAGGAVPYMWPRAAAAPYIDTTVTPFRQKFPAVGTWDTVQLGAGGAGISLSATDIGTTNNPPNQINYSLAHDTLNTLYADVTNNSGASIPAGTLRARFRIANWGSQNWSATLAGMNDWIEVPPPTPPVRTNASNIANGSTGPDRRITDPWTITAADAVAWTSKPSHQCLLVTLSGVPPAQYDFVNDSAFNNMWFVQIASAIEYPAEIKVPLVRGGIRGRLPFFRPAAVYMFVSASNMPLSVPPTRPLPPRWIRPALPLDKPLLGEHITEIHPDIAIDPREPVTIDRLASIMTTLRYFVYRDTGRKIKVGGQIRPLLQPQTSFGYFVQHQKPILGWDSALVGNFSRVEGTPNMFKLAAPLIGKTGTVTIRTRVIGYETQPPLRRLPQILPATAGPIQSKIPILKNLPSITNLPRIGGLINGLRR